MGQIKKIINLVLAVALSFNATANAAFTEKEKADLSRYRDFLAPMGYKLYVNEKERKAEVYDTTTKKLAMEIPFNNEDTLRRFSPKALNIMLLDEMSKIKHVTKSTFSHTVKNLPAESAMFFMAMGAVVAGQLITNYSQNPVAMQQHINHQLSPLGVMGFFTFMYSQGVTANILSMYIKNPKFHHMIPYLGMTVGAFTQTYLSTVVSDPNVKACGKSLVGIQLSEKEKEVISKDPCESAYEHLVIKKKIWEFAPSIASMLISSGLAAGGQALVTKAVLRVTGVNLAVWLMPGTMQVKGFRVLLAKGVQLSAFVAIDIWLHRKVTYAWRNFFDGAQFYDINKELNAKINIHKKTNWNLPSADLTKDLKEFHTRMVDWRMMNMSEVYESHSFWSEALKNLTSMYNSSYTFYNSMVNEIRSVRYKETKTPALTRQYPYFGIVPSDLALNPYDVMLTHPEFLENLQEESIVKASNYLAYHLKNVEVKPFYKAYVPKLKALQLKLASGDKTKITEGLLTLKQELQAPPRSADPGHVKYFAVLQQVKKTLGSPNPMMQAGQGYVMALEKSSQAEVFKGSKFDNKVGRYPTFGIGNYLVMQMACGPDANLGEEIVKTPQVAGSHTGYPSYFLPPRITNLKGEAKSCGSWGSIKMANNIYEDVLNEGGKQYKGHLDLIVNTAKNDIIGPRNASTFPQWWTNKTENQMKKAFAEYSRSYDEVIVKMIAQVFNYTTSSWNRGPVANGLMNSAYQELRMYLSLLNDLMNPATQFNTQLADLIKTTVKTPEARAIEGEFTKLQAMIKSIKVVNVGGTKRIQSKLENYQLEEQLAAIQKELSNTANLLGVGEDDNLRKVDLTNSQKEVATLLLQQIQTLSSEVLMYGSMANAVSWDKITNLEKGKIDNSNFNNSVQNGMNKIRSMALPGM